MVSLRCRLGYHDYQGQLSMRCQRCGLKLIVLSGTGPKVTQPGDPNRHRIPSAPLNVPAYPKYQRLKRVK